MSGDKTLFLRRYCRYYGCNKPLEDDYKWNWCRGCKNYLDGLNFGERCRTDRAGLGGCPNNAVEGGRLCEYHE